MSKVIKLKKGFDINLAGKAALQLTEHHPETVAIKFDDFPGMYRPKIVVKEGDTVKAGSALFFDKAMEDVIYASPVSGEVIAVHRGEKRKPIEIVILCDRTIQYQEHRKFTISEIANLSAEDALTHMVGSGVWVQVIQRPFGIVANPHLAPRDIFISTFDTSPLAPDYEFIFKGQEQYFQVGIEILRKVGKCDIHLGINAAAEVSKVFGSVNNVRIHKFMGPHPAGNVGVQIHHIAPINKGDIVWTLHPYGVIQIGKLFLEGRYDASKIIAVAGSEVKQPQYYKTFTGANISKLVANNLKSQHVRFISGNVLTGCKIEANGHLGFYDHLLTVIPEGDKPRFFLTEGWLAPVTNRLSFHRAFGLLSFLNSKTKEYVLDTSTNGEERAFVMTGAFEQVVPMDILPLHLIKAILANDYDGMEALGIYEVIEEDLALCEFIDVSKQPIQQIIRQGINMMRES
ncbi:MAG: Na(+)-translocating NADH-quinone reductase subunit A [Cytophagales bacterium]|nr:Na(+)-translocating NADH-quinone reductase subunit A [Bernardetiaceae bacterium]MDW8210059.1 Na(+)-translocating NADH-quinone reductase subunit A [Cytophagales bacterium]